MPVVLLIRHGEKKGNDLSKTGRKRAEFLPDYFKKFRPTDVPLPTHLVSMRPKHRSSSRRCVDTLIPMMREMRMSLVVEFDREEVDVLVSFVERLPQEAVVLICWEHHWIVEIARALGFNVLNWNDTPFSNCQDSKAFDVLWKIDGLSFESFVTYSVTRDGVAVYEDPLRERVVLNPLVVEKTVQNYVNSINDRE